MKINQIFDRIFKRIFALSDTAIISLINGLFGTEHPTDSPIVYTNRESTNSALEHRFADVFLTIAGRYHYHLEAQSTADEAIVLRAFEYGFYHAMESRDDNYSLTLPEPVIIYLGCGSSLPAESVIHIHCSGQGTFDYRVKNFVYLDHSLAELNQKKLIVLIPFQVLRIRDMLYDAGGNLKHPSQEEFQQLQKIVTSDIVNNIERNLSAGNINADDANQLVELTNQLYDQIILYYQEKGGENAMKPLLPGAIELPNDKYRFRIDELEKENRSLADENSAQADKISTLTDENSALAGKISILTDEIAILKTQIAALRGNPS